ncbi:MAG: sodium:proton antiporter NhaD [Bacteroidia bacterium]|nr:sodium:proton antiporter NhaD [Bacteroidia bacterium]
MTTTLIVIVFLVGYVLIAIESYTKINKSAIALLMSVICWTIYNVTYGATPEFTTSFGETCETLFFLMGAMAIVEVVDTNGGFNFVKDRLKTKNKRTLLWRLIFITFFLSAVLDNLTTSIVMIMVLNKLIDGKTDRLLMSSMVILAANSGGAFSPIGDVTTIMLWVKGNISSFGIIKAIILPSIASVVVPGLLISSRLKGEVLVPAAKPEDGNGTVLISKKERSIVFFIGVGGLIFVPVFRLLTDLPPFMGIMMVLGSLWVVTELIFKQKRLKKIAADALPDIARLLHKVDLSTIFFFLGILTTVAALSQTGVLKAFGERLDNAFDGNPYIVTGIIGILSSVVDNVPLVASCMGMYDLVPAGMEDTLIYGVDGSFWSLLSYCAGVGGSILIIGSAAGVVVMGLQKISFGWYLKNISWMALLGYFSGIAVYWLQNLIF